MESSGIREKLRSSRVATLKSDARAVAAMSKIVCPDCHSLGGQPRPDTSMNPCDDKVKWHDSESGEQALNKCLTSCPMRSLPRPVYTVQQFRRAVMAASAMFSSACSVSKASSSHCPRSIAIRTLVSISIPTVTLTTQVAVPLPLPRYPNSLGRVLELNAGDGQDQQGCERLAGLG